MLTNARAFSGFSADDIGREKKFYGDILGLDVTEEYGMLNLNLPDRQRVMIYPKDNHAPATYTVLNFEVDDIEAAVDGLSEAGVTFERYGADFEQDERGISRGAPPPIAWFKDPAGNILSLIQS